jgi:hypothetical protein
MPEIYRLQAIVEQAFHEGAACADENILRERTEGLFRHSAARADMLSEWTATHRHVKSGKLVRVITLEGVIEATMAAAAIYDEADGTTWIRPLEEFNDGRFVEWHAPGTLGSDSAKATLVGEDIPASLGGFVPLNLGRIVDMDGETLNALAVLLYGQYNVLNTRALQDANRHAQITLGKRIAAMGLL